MQSRECQVKRYDNFPQSMLLLVCYAVANIAQDTIGCLCCLCTLVASAQLAIHQVLFNRPAPPQPVSLLPSWIVAACIVSFPGCSSLHLSLLNVILFLSAHSFRLSSFGWQPCSWVYPQLPLFGVICKPDESTLHCLLQVIDKDAKQDRSHYRRLQVEYNPLTVSF